MSLSLEKTSKTNVKAMCSQFLQENAVEDSSKGFYWGPGRLHLEVSISELILCIL